MATLTVPLGRVHLGAGPVLLPDRGLMLAAFHTKSREFVYDNYLYLFDPEPPYSMLCLSANRLPLAGQTTAIAFVAGLAIFFMLTRRLVALQVEYSQSLALLEGFHPVIPCWHNFTVACLLGCAFAFDDLW